MQHMVSGLVAVCVGVASIGAAQAGPWTSAKFPGEQGRAVQGCADEVQKPGDWVCVVVRCDQPGAALSLHFSTSGPDIQGEVKLAIDNETFPVTVPVNTKSPLPLSTRAQVAPAALIEAMKSGAAIEIRGTQLEPPYNRISLESSRKAIEWTERSCGRSFPSAVSLWRRLTLGMF